MHVVSAGSPGRSSAATITAALQEALHSGPPVAPLPNDPAEAEAVRAMLQPDRPVTEPDAAAIVATSGSTGQPKGVVLSRAAMTASAEATHERLGGPGRWLLALPGHYVAGLMVLARAVIADLPVCDVGTDLSGLAQAVERPGNERCYVSLVPTQLTRALRDAALTAALVRTDAVLLGGGPATPDLVDRAQQAGIRVVTTYGMSETCGGCVYDGYPLDGVQLGLAAEGARGDRILLGGPTVFSGYRLRPDLTEQTLVDGSVRTNDRGELNQGRLRVLGRFDDVVVSGGLNIDLAEVEAAARGWPGLGGGDIAVVGVPDADWGTKLVAYAEQGPDAGQLELSRLKGHLDGRIAHPHHPKDLVVLSRLPRTAAGKIDRRQLVAGHGPGSEGAR